MKKAYEPQKMVAQSRFRDFYEKWKNEEKIELLNEMARLIEENSAYADRNNYAHMCNLITSLVMIIVLEKSGKTREEAEKEVADAMYLFIQPQIASMQKLAGNSWFVRMLKISMPIKFRHTLGYGWDVEFPKCAGDTFSMITHKCIYQQIFSKYGMPEMTAVFCRADDVLYSNLPRAEFLYTQQIGNGGSMCDYTFKKR